MTDTALPTHNNLAVGVLDERLPWEEADLTSDEDIATDTLTPERLERLRELADRFATTPRS